MEGNPEPEADASWLPGWGPDGELAVEEVPPAVSPAACLQLPAPEHLQPDRKQAACRPPAPASLGASPSRPASPSPPQTQERTSASPNAWPSPCARSSRRAACHWAPGGSCRPARSPWLVAQGSYISFLAFSTAIIVQTKQIYIKMHRSKICICEEASALVVANRQLPTCKRVVMATQDQPQAEALCCFTGMCLRVEVCLRVEILLAG